MTQAGSPSEAWKTLNDWFNPQTPGREVDLFFDLINASMPSDGNPIKLYARLINICHQLSSNMEDPGVVRFVRNNLLNMKLLSALPRSYEAEVRALRVDASKGTLDRDHVKRVMSDRYQHLERVKKKPRHQKEEDEAYITQGSSGGGQGRHKGKGSKFRRRNRDDPKDGTSPKSATSTSSVSTNSGKSRKPSSASGSAGGKPCAICWKNNHKPDNCPDRTCGRCGGKGHGPRACGTSAAAVCQDEEEACDSDFGILVMDQLDEDTGRLAHPGESVLVCPDDKGDKTQCIELWYGDSAASRHVTHSKDALYNFAPVESSLRTANGKPLRVLGRGSLDLRVVSSGEPTTVTLRDVLYSPDIAYHLFSLRSAALRGNSYEGSGDVIRLNLKRGGMLNFHSHGNLNCIEAVRVQPEYAHAVLAPAKSQVSTDRTVDVNVFHAAYGHQNEVLLRETAKAQNVILTGEMQPCLGCSLAKGLRKPIPSSSTTRATTKLARVYVDLCGPKSVASRGGKRYVLLVRDCYTRFTWIYFLKSKSEAVDCFRRFLCDVRADGVPSKVQKVRSDSGGEFSVNGPFGALCRERGIKQELTTAHTPERNAVAERGIALIESAALAARLHAPELYPNVGVPKATWLWAESLSWATDSLNRSATRANPQHRSPYEMWHGKPAPTRILPFLKPGFAKVQRTNKLQPKAQECFYLGPATNHASDVYRVLVKSGSVICSRDITWRHVPTIRAGDQLKTTTPQTMSDTSGEGGIPVCSRREPVHVPESECSTVSVERRPGKESFADEFPDCESSASDESSSVDYVPGEFPSLNDPASAEPRPEDVTSPGEPASPDPAPTIAPTPSTPPDEESDQGVEEEKIAQPLQSVASIEGPPSRRTRSKASAPELSYSFLVASDLNSEGKGESSRLRDCAYLTEVKQKVSHALASAEVHEVNPVSVPHVPLSEIEPEPVSYSEAMSSQHRNVWVNAMKAEFKGLQMAGTFSEDAIPPGRKPVSSRWIFKWKRDQSGNVVKAKARLVAKGFSQVHGQDFFETFAPTPSMSAIRTLAAFACENELPLFHLDAEQAFIQSKLQEEIYLKLPPGCGEWSGKVTQLRRSLYGLKQASREWGNLLASSLKKLNFERCLVDPCIYRLMNGDRVRVIVGVHVDDMIVVASNEDCLKLQKKLSKFFPVKHLGVLTWYMGCSFERNGLNGTLKITQETFASSLVEKFGISKESSIPASPSVELLPRGEDEPQTTEPYREAVGSLMWLANTTRPDLSQAVRAVARHSHDPGISHWKAVVKILSYVASTTDLGLTYRRGSGKRLSVYVDASFAPRDNERKSVSGGAVLYGKAVVSWFSRSQRCVALSSTESEYIAASEGIREALFLRGVIAFIQPNVPEEPILVFEDNEGAIKLAENPMSSARSKHLDTRYHHIRMQCAENVVKLRHVSSDRQHADILTKPLAAGPFSYHRNALMGIKN